MTANPQREADIVIVGGGLAGMAAAESLLRFSPDSRIVLLEGRTALGGRAGSFIDRDSGSEIDYCQHVAMGCCTNFVDLMRRADLIDRFERVQRLTFMHAKHPPSRFAATRWLPAPLHLVGTLAKQKYLTLWQKAQVIHGFRKLMRTPRASLINVSARDWLLAADQSERTIREFWDIILVSALAEHSQNVAMSAAQKVLLDGFAAAHGASDLLIPTEPLKSLFGRQLPDHLIRNGVQICTDRHVRSIRFDGTVQTSDGDYRPDHVVCAVPHHAIARLFENWDDEQRQRLPRLTPIASIPSSPITGIHLWFDDEITTLSHAVLVGTTIQWVFRNPYRDDLIADSARADSGQREHYVQVVISASRSAEVASHEQLLEKVLSELRQFFPATENANLIRHRVVTDPRSVFSIRPEVEVIRPPSGTELPWLHLAGDWTQTQWPATMEGAVISGRAAAASVLGQMHGNDRVPQTVVPGLPRGRLCRWLFHDRSV